MNTLKVDVAVIGAGTAGLAAYRAATAAGASAAIIEGGDCGTTCARVGCMPSKLTRLMDMNARRLRLQERLTQQISNVVMAPVNAEGVGVIIEARRPCVMMRGVGKQNN